MSARPCFRCREPSVFHQRYSGRHLCASHLAADILVRVKRTIRLQGGLGKKPVMAIVWEGQACFSLLSLMSQVIGDRPSMEIVLLHCGIDSIPGSEMSDFLSPAISIRSERVKPDEIVLAATQAGADRLLWCRTLDDEAEEVLHSLLSGNCSSLLTKEDCSPLVNLTPFREIPLSELFLYAAHAGLLSPDMEAREGTESTRGFLESLIHNHPSVPFSLLAYADQLHDLR